MMGFLGLRPPSMKTRELRVPTSEDTDDLAPAAGKRLRVLGYCACSTVDVNLISTVRATLAFGTGHTSDPDKIICSHRHERVGTPLSSNMSNLNLIGEVDEVVRLTNITFSIGSVITRAVIYYVEV